MYLAAKRVFTKEKYISTGMLQRYFQISYFDARFILDQMIKEGFCEKQHGAWPSRIVRQTN